MNILINYELGADLFCVKNGKNKKAEVFDLRFWVYTAVV